MGGTFPQLLSFLTFGGMFRAKCFFMYYSIGRVSFAQNKLVSIISTSPLLHPTFLTMLPIAAGPAPPLLKTLLRQPHLHRRPAKGLSRLLHSAHCQGQAGEELRRVQGPERHPLLRSIAHQVV